MGWPSSTTGYWVTAGNVRRMREGGVLNLNPLVLLWKFYRNLGRISSEFRETAVIAPGIETGPGDGRGYPCNTAAATNYAPRPRYVYLSTRRGKAANLIKGMGVSPSPFRSLALSLSRVPIAPPFLVSRGHKCVK